MRTRGGILRILMVFAACVALLGYNIYGKVLRKTTGEITAIAADDDNGLVFSFGETGSTDAVSSKTSTSSQSESSSGTAVAASASGSVKGKIISKYISPYNAGLSYDKAYVKNATELKPDLKSLISAKLSFKLQKSNNPVVLIMHTHTTETFMTRGSDTYTDSDVSRSRDKTRNMVAIGNIVADKLNNAGIKTVHDTTEHDYPNYTGSYTRAAKTINSYLKKYPSIKIVMDLHRDAVSSGNGDKVKLVTEIGGKKAAQVMIVMGSQSGGVTNFPNWKENFKLALKMQREFEKKYPTLARPLSLNSKNYNESLTKGSVLIEFGTDANTLDEVKYSAEMVGDSLSGLFSTFY